ERLCGIGQQLLRFCLWKDRQLAVEKDRSIILPCAKVQSAHVLFKKSAGAGYTLANGKLARVGNGRRAKVDPRDQAALARKLDRIQPRTTGDIEQPHAWL